jgi:cell division transport system ATP-binding protein
VITLSQVSMVFPDASWPALHQINLTIEKGEWLFLFGPAGSGKSTLLRVIHGQVIPTIGTVTVNKRHLSGISARRRQQLRRSIGYVPQPLVLASRQTAYEHVAFALRVIGKTDAVARRVVPEILELVGLERKMDRYVGELADGERQRVAIAMAFVNRPLIMLVDEPTSAMDPDTEIEMMRLLDRINRTGTTVVMSTSDANIVNQMRRRFVRLDRGSVIDDNKRGIDD